MRNEDIHNFLTFSHSLSLLIIPIVGHWYLMIEASISNQCKPPLSIFVSTPLFNVTFHDLCIKEIKKLVG